MGGPSWPGGWNPFEDLEREVGRILGTFEPLSWKVARPFPAVNLYDAGDRYVLTAELPGVATEEIELSISGDTLTLRGERKRREGIADESYRRQERTFGRWARRVRLPERVRGGEESAVHVDGVLTVTIPKSEESRPRTIAVRSST